MLMRINRTLVTTLLTTAVLCSACAKVSSSPDDGEDFSTPGSIVKGGGGFNGDNQSAPAGSSFATPLGVTVFTPGGKKCNGCEVRWSLSPIAFSNGIIATTTDVTGTVLFTITGLSPRGSYQVRATIGNGQYVSFTLTAI